MAGASFCCTTLQRPASTAAACHRDGQLRGQLIIDRPRAFLSQYINGIPCVCSSASTNIHMNFQLCSGQVQHTVSSTTGRRSLYSVAEKTLCRLAEPRPAQSTNNLEVKLRGHEATMVKPAVQSACSSYFLSNIDLQLMPLSINLALFFDARNAAVSSNLAQDDPAQVMEVALPRVLAHYYPLAGRLMNISSCDDDDHGRRPFVACNDDGVGFAAADASVTIAELGDLHSPESMSRLAPLFYHFHFPADNAPLLTAQVTRFKCGGFALSLAFRHCMCDGFGIGNFLKSWGEYARGLPQLSLEPVLDRTFLKARTPLQVQYSHPEFADLEDLSSCTSSSAASNISPSTAPPPKLVARSFRFTQQSLDALRRQVLEEGMVSKCSTFEALGGLLWRARTTALGMNPAQQVKVLIAIDGRLNRKVGLPRGYIGNGGTNTAAVVSAGELGRKPLSFAVQHVQGALNKVTDGYIRSQVDYLERQGFRLPSLTATLALSSWTRLPFYDCDFGWGKPTHCFPVGLMVPSVAPTLPFGEDRKGCNVLLCHFPEVVERMSELLDPYIVN